jgi:epoxyqueuosine reductase
MDRRDFFKKAGIASVVAGAAVITASKKASAKLVLSKEHDEFPYEFSPDFKGFKQKNMIFCRGFWDKEPINAYVKDLYGFQSYEHMLVNFAAQFDGYIHQDKWGEPGYAAYDKALDLASWSTLDKFAPYSQFGVRNALIPTHPVNPMTGEIFRDKPAFVPSMHTWDNSEAEYTKKHGNGRYQFKDAKEATKHIKRAAKFLGADLVGVTSFERAKKWVFTEWAVPIPDMIKYPDGEVKPMVYNPFEAKKGNFKAVKLHTVPSDFKREAGFEPKSCIVMAFEMDYDGYKTAPSLVAGAATGDGYSRMAEVSSRVSSFLRKLGIKAIPCGNDTALSVPLAIEAGLGEGSRMGMIITEKYGPRVRLAKIFTDIELVPDKHKTFGVKDFCRVCKKCADACPANAISTEPAQIYKQGQEMSTGKVNKSNCAGVEKFFVNAERCYGYWSHSGTDCGTCVSVCPYNKIDDWHHDLTKIATLTPFKPLLRDFDEWFGYGGPIDESRTKSKWFKDAVTDFWNKE